MSAVIAHVSEIPVNNNADSMTMAKIRRSTPNPALEVNNILTLHTQKFHKHLLP